VIWYDYAISCNMALQQRRSDDFNGTLGALFLWTHNNLVPCYVIVVTGEGYACTVLAFLYSDLLGLSLDGLI